MWYEMKTEKNADGGINMYRLVETRFAFLINLLNILLNHWKRLIGKAIESRARANRIAESMMQTNNDDLINLS